MSLRSIPVVLSAATALAAAGCASAGRLPEPQPLAVVTYNVGDVIGARPTPAQIAEVLAGLPWADLYVLQEVITHADADEITETLSRLAGIPYHLAYAVRPHLAVLSRSPITATAERHPAGSCDACGALRVDTTHGARRISVVDVHLDPIPKTRTPDGTVRFGPLRAAGVILREVFARTPRTAAVRDLLDWVAADGQSPIILAGDFNTIPASRAIRLATRHYVDAQDRAGRGASGTYRRVSGPVRPRVDFVLVSDAFVVLDAEVGKHTAGDHLPVSVTLTLR